MAQFRATIQGNRGEASRLGTKNSGLDVTVNGWNVGVSVTARYNSETGNDEIRVFVTKGSNGGHGGWDKVLTVREGSNGPTVNDD